jgi:transcriptional regulator with XRE-family HTH domain
MPAGKWKSRMRTHQRVGAKIKELRLKYDLTQTYLASCLGCSGSSVSSLEAGKFGSMELLEGLLWALGLELSDMDLGEHQELISLQRGRRSREPARQFTGAQGTPRRLRAVG